MRLLLAPIVAISCFGQTYTVQTFAGGALPGGVAGTSASLGRVGTVATDSGGNIFIGLPDYNVVVKLDAVSGLLTRVAGNGTAGYGGDNGAATSAQLGLLGGLAVDGSGNLYIGDGYRVRRVSNGTISTVAGNGTSGYGGDGGPATSAQLRSTAGLAVDASDDLYIADSYNNRVRKVTNGVIATVAGSGVAGYGGDNGQATAAQLSGPLGVALDASGNLYIADTLNNRVRMVTNGIITTVAGNGTNGSGEGSGDGGPAPSASLIVPESIAVDTATGDLYIAEAGASRVRRVSKGIITTVAGTGEEGDFIFGGDGGPAANAPLEQGLRVAADTAGNLYIGEVNNSCVRKVSGGIITTVAGRGDTVGDNGSPVNAQLDTPRSVALDSLGNVYITDGGESRVREVTNGKITTIAGNGTVGNSGDGGSAKSSQLGFPQGVAVDYNGSVYIADLYDSCVRKVSGGTITTFLRWQHSTPVAIATDNSGNVYIADGIATVVKVSPGGTATTMAGTGVAGYTGDGGPPAAAELNYPQGVAVDTATGDLYVADTYNNVVRRISNGTISTVAGNNMSGNCLNCGDGGPATLASLTNPEGVATDTFGNLYILESVYNQTAGINSIRMVSGGVITTIAGQIHTGDSIGGSVGSPIGLAVDAVGNVYVSDPINNRVRVLVPSGTACSYSVTTPAQPVPASGGSMTVSIQTTASCAWAVQSLPDWLTFSGNAIGSGAGTVSLTFSANTGAARSAQISIAGATVTVNQAGVLLVNTGGVVNGASYTAPVVPGSIAAIFGNFLLPAPVEVSMFPVPTNLGGLSFQFGDGTMPPLFYGNVGQVNAQVPWELAGQSQTTITATINGQTSAPQTVSLATYAPGIFALNSEGTGPGAILDANYHLVDASNPAIPGQTTILIYCTGLGPVSSNQPATGAPASLTNLAHTSSPVTATIGGVSANVTFSGLAPGYVGLYQVNAQVPAGLAANNSAPVMISIEGANSNTVTIAVQ